MQRPVLIIEDDQDIAENLRYNLELEGLKVRVAETGEKGLAAALARSAGRVGTRQRLLDDVWGHQYYGDQRTLDVHIRRLRHKLGACGECIETVIGIGYRFAGCSIRAGTQTTQSTEE